MEIKKLENSSVQLTLTLGAAAIEEDYSKTIKDYAKKLTLKGFRPGKASSAYIARPPSTPCWHASRVATSS